MCTDFNGICVSRTAVAVWCNCSKFRYDCEGCMVLLPLGQALYYEGHL